MALNPSFPFSVPTGSFERGKWLRDQMSLKVAILNPISSGSIFFFYSPYIINLVHAEIKADVMLAFVYFQ